MTVTSVHSAAVSCQACQCMRFRSLTPAKLSTLWTERYILTFTLACLLNVHNELKSTDIIRLLFGVGVIKPVAVTGLVAGQVWPWTWLSSYMVWYLFAQTLSYFSFSPAKTFTDGLSGPSPWSQY